MSTMSGKVKSKSKAQQRAEKFRKQLIAGDIMPSKKYDFKKPSFIQRIVSTIADATGVPVRKTAPKIGSYVFLPEYDIRRPGYDYPTLMFEANNSWLMRMIARVIIGEVTTPRWHRVPKFIKKCTKCGKESSATSDKCECGGKKFRYPDAEQADKFDALIDKPNPNYEFLDIVRTIINYLIVLDDFYIYIPFKEVFVNGKRTNREPAQLYVLDSRFTFPIADDRGRLGSTQYYCPICYAMNDKDIYVDSKGLPPEQQVRPMCEIHGEQMLQTAYVQEVNGQIVARFTAEQVLHGSMSRILPELFGNPKIVSVIKLLRSINSMDDYNYEVYNEGKVGSIVAFPKYDPEQVTELKNSIEAELKQKAQTEVQSGSRQQSRKIRTVFIPVEEPPVRIPIMENLEAMQSLEFYKLWIEKVCAVFGVTPVFVSVSEGGRLGTSPRLQIDVQDRVTREYQKAVEDFMNMLVLPLFKITDWLFKFKEIEQRDKLRDAQIEHERAATALTWLQGGFNVEVSPSGELVVSGKGSQFPLRQPQNQKPRSLTEGAASGVESVNPETEDSISEATDALTQKDVTALPASWFETTQMQLLNDEIALNSDKDEVFVLMNQKEVAGTRVPSNQYSLAVAKLIDVSLGRLLLLFSKPGFPKDELESVRRYAVQNLQRKYDSNVLLSIVQFFDRVYLPEIAAQFNELRARLDKIHHSTTEEVI